MTAETLTDDVAPVAPSGTTTPGPAGADPSGPAPARGRGRPRKDQAPKKGPGRPTNDDKLRGKVAELYGGIGLMVMLYDADLAARIMESADELADAWVKLAAEYPAVRRLLERMATTSAIGAFLAVHFRVFGPTLLEKFGGNLAGLFGGGGVSGDVIPGPWAPEGV